MKVLGVQSNNHRHAFEVRLRGRTLFYPYTCAAPPPSPSDRVAEAWVDAEIGREGFTYTLESGREGTVHVDQVLEYAADPAYRTEMLLYSLTIEAQRRLEHSPLSRRELIRRLRTSASQFYRLLDPANTRKSLGQLVALLHLLGCQVDVVVRERA